MALLLTGPPGSGKTTALRAAARTLEESYSLVGFYTEEIRTGRERRGFRLVTFRGEQAIIAHVDFPPPRVSKYGVDVAAIDRFAETLRHPDRSDICLIDEIGKMECLSAAFVDATTDLLERGRPLVASVAQRGEGFIARVKHRRDVELWTITRATRDTLPARIVDWVHQRIGRTR